MLMEIFIKQAKQSNGIIFGAADITLYGENEETIYVTYKYKQGSESRSFEEFNIHDISLDLHKRINWPQEQRLKAALKNLTDFSISGGF